MTSSGGDHDYQFVVTDSGDVDLSGLNVSGFTANVPGHTAAIHLMDTNTTSVTVYGAENGFAASTSGDILEVAGLGDSVRPGTGNDLVIFGVAERRQRRSGPLQLTWVRRRPRTDLSRCLWKAIW